MDSEKEKISESFICKDDDGKEIEFNVLEAEDGLLGQKECSDEKILCKELQTQAGEEVISVKVEDEDEGFNTPTSQKHKIEAIKLQCPPAPRKPKSLPSSANKRKSFDANSTTVRRLIDQSTDDVESLFPSDHHFHHTKVKKPRTA